MLATMSNSQLDISMHRSHLDLDPPTYDIPPEPSYGMEDRLCPGCKKSAVTENGGLVVAFGQSFFHVDCFRCAKCSDQVTADTNLLLLSDGSPICANCSYSCNVCHLPILDEAIMTGDDSYHAHCFKCKVCKNRIDELVFAKTTQGIYCMHCHSERMIKIRKHAQKKAEREKLAGGSSTSPKLRDRETRNLHRENGGDSGHASPLALTPPPYQDGFPQLQQPPAHSNEPPPIRSPVKKTSGSYVSDAFESSFSSFGPEFSPISPRPLPTPLSPTSPTSPSLSVTLAPPEESSRPSHTITLTNIFPRSAQNPVLPNVPPDSAGSTAGRSNALPVPGGTALDPESIMNRRKSYDDGLRPLNVMFKQKSPNGANAPESDGLNVQPTPRADKRRSVMPGLNPSNYNPMTSISPPPSTPPNLSPTIATIQLRSQTPPGYGRESPAMLSPLREKFPESTSSRPLSHSSSHYSSASSNPRSATSSPVPPDKDARCEPVLRSASADQGSCQPKAARQPMRPLLTADKVPPRKSSLLDINGRHLHDNQLHGLGSGAGNGHPLRLKRSFHDRKRPAADANDPRATSSSQSRPGSPARNADVPDDVEEEGGVKAPGVVSNGEAPPAPPPKDREDRDTRRTPDQEGQHTPELTFSAADIDADTSFTSHNSVEGSEDMSETSSPVERVSHSTFIAPALPPIRFSLSGADFSELLSSVGGLPSYKSLDHLARLSEEGHVDSALGDMTIVGPSLSEEEEEDESTAVDDTITTIRVSRDKASSDGMVERSPSPKPRVSIDAQTPHPSLQSNISTKAMGSTSITLTGSRKAQTSQNEDELVIRRLRAALTVVNERGPAELKVDQSFIIAIVRAMEQRMKNYNDLKKRMDNMKRASAHYMDGLTVAQAEYDRELKARRDAEAEVTRLRVLLSGQVARLTALSTDSKRQVMREQMSKKINDSLTGLEHDLSKLKVERDIALAEVEELSATKSSPIATQNPELPAANLSRSLTMRLDHIKTKYQHDLVPLTQEREALAREIAELKAVRDAFLEETTVLNVRNEELAQLSAQYARRMDLADAAAEKRDGSGSFDRLRTQHSPQLMTPSFSLSTNGSVSDDTLDTRYNKIQKHDQPEFPTPSSKGKFIKWPGSKAKELAPPTAALESSKGKARLEHAFQQLSVLRFTRCDQCGDKMWGSQLRCTGCNISVHVRCINNVHGLCSQQVSTRDEGQMGSLPASMFGRDLTEQVRADSSIGGDRQTPFIVEKCIDAVEATALELEGIYRKNGGSGQTKAITQLFERGDYHAFDLRDTDRFNDICSVTSVLKAYLRSLPIPLLTYDLHDHFMSAVQNKEIAAKNKAMMELVNKMPNEHYYTLRMLMLHLHRVCERREKNLMNARNLGVVFGPTLMRSRDPTAEFSDMAGKALSVEWLVENATRIFK